MPGSCLGSFYEIILNGTFLVFWKTFEVAMNLVFTRNKVIKTFHNPFPQEILLSIELLIDMLLKKAYAVLNDAKWCDILPAPCLLVIIIVILSGISVKSRTEGLTLLFTPFYLLSQPQGLE